MARPTKKGLDYFPLNIDFFEDEKIEAISGEFGLKGEMVAIKLLCAVYNNGYFILWNDLQKMKLLKRLPGINLELLEQIVKRLVKWNFFDENLFNSANIITSKGIQERFFEATKRRKENDFLEHLLINVSNNGVNVNKNSFTDDINVNISTQSKVKESNNINTSINIEDIYTKNENSNSENSDLKSEKKEKEKSSAKKEKAFSKTDFKNKLLELGADETHIDDWFKARISKKAQFTETALNALINECNKNNFPIAEAVRTCAERSWQGFKYQWILNEQAANGTSQQATSNASSESKQPYFFDRQRAMQTLTGQNSGGLSEN